MLTRSAVLAIYTVVVIGILEWAITGSSGNEPRHRIEAVVPGGVTTLTAAWALGSLWIIITWLRARAAPAGLSVLGLFFVLVGYLVQWSRRLALPTGGGISPSEVWLYLAGGLGVAFAFGAVLTIVVLVGVIRTRSP
jgi:hypothetical protein